ncbi:cytochrome P450 [Caballeronia jiangsuensis]|nr:cytochrome P450 [Caballeronia jiangsuensis]
MTDATESRPALIPDDIARIVVNPKSYTEDDVIYPALKWLRTNTPVGRAEIDGYDPMWIVSKHADIMTVGKQPNLFSNAAESEILYDRANDQFMKAMNNGNPHLVSSLTAMDPPMHTSYRSLTSNWFLPANIRRLEERVRVIAKASVERLLQFDGRCDFMSDCALYYPLHVIMTAFGVPEEDEGRMLRLTQDFFGVHDPDEHRDELPKSPDAAAKQWHAALNDFYSYFSALTKDRRERPRDDLMSLIANSQVDGKPIEEEYANGYYVAIATAGHDTTSSTTGGAMLGMARFPDQFRLVKENGALIPGLVDEALRWNSPVKHFMRTATADTSISGQEIKSGDRLMLSYPSGNRDESVFANPDVFDITRSPNRHLAFGWGAHMCLGQHLGKLEMRIFFEELLPRLKSFELDGDPKLVETNFVGGLKRLPIRFEKA